MSIYMEVNCNDTEMQLRYKDHVQVISTSKVDVNNDEYV